MLALIYLQAWSMLLCMHIYIRMLRGVNTAYGVKGCVSNTACVIIVMHVVTWFYANRNPNDGRYRERVKGMGNFCRYIECSASVIK